MTLTCALNEIPIFHCKYYALACLPDGARGECWMKQLERVASGQRGHAGLHALVLEQTATDRIGML